MNITIGRVLAVAIVMVHLGFLGCVANLNTDLELTAVLQAEASYVSPTNGPIIAFQVSVQGAPVGDVTATFEFTVDGTAYAPVPLHDAASGTIDGNRLLQCPTNQFVLLEWDTTDLAVLAVLNAVQLRVTVEDESGEAPIVALSGTFILDNTALFVNAPPVLSQPTGPGTVTGVAPAFSANVLLGESLDMSVTATDNNGWQTLAFDAEVVGGSLTAAEAGFMTPLPVSRSGAPPQSISLAGTAAQEGELTLRFTVDDGNGGTAIITVAIIISTIPNVPPTLAVTGATQSGANQWSVILQRGETLPQTIGISGSDADAGDDLTLTAVFSSGVSENYTSVPAAIAATPAFVSGTSTSTAIAPVVAAISLAPGPAFAIGGKVVLLLTVTDSAGASANGTLHITVNAAPVINEPTGPGNVTGSSPHYTAYADASGDLNFSVTANDANSNDTITMSMSVTGGTLSPVQAGFFTSFPATVSSWSPATLNITGQNGLMGSIEFTITASDGNGGSSTVVLSVVLGEPPGIANSPSTVGHVGETYAWTPAVTGFPTPSIIVTGLPVWLSWNGTTLSGTPSVGDAGQTSTITITASNGIFPAAIETFMLDVPTWVTMNSGTSSYLRSVWGSAANDVFAAGDGGLVLRFNGANWNAQVTPTTRGLYGIWGNAANDVFAVGTTGTILRFNGSYWAQMVTPTAQLLRSVWGTSGSNVYAVGNGGTILHFNGSVWTEMNSPTGYTLYGIWGTSPTNIYAVGYTGIVLRYNGTSWGIETDTPPSYLTSIWGTGPDDIYSVGTGGTVMHYNGSYWATISTAYGVYFYGLTGFSSTDQFAVGNNGTVRHFDGSTWNPQFTGSTRILYGVWGSAPNNVFAVGSNGAILRYHVP